jgi:hypothetical protein
MSANPGSNTEVEGSVLDYYFCGISQLPDDKFCSNILSDLCPVVGLCGHSYAKGNLKSWAAAQERKKDIMRCPLNCSHKVKIRGLDMFQSQPIPAFRVEKLAPNYSLCVAIDDIDFLKSKLKEARSPRQTEAAVEAAMERATFHKCRKCCQRFSTESKNAHGGRPAPNAPIVGVCGHTFCLNCIYDMHADALSRTTSHTLKYFSCNECGEKKAFHSEVCCENIGLRNALLYWHALIQGRIDLRDEEEEAVTRSRASEEATTNLPVRQQIKREDPCSQWAIQESDHDLLQSEEEEEENDHEGEADGEPTFHNNQYSSSIHGNFTEESNSQQRTFTSLKREASEDEHSVTDGANLECNGDQLERSARSQWS